MENLTINSGKKDSNKFQVVDLKSNEKINRPSNEQIKGNRWILATYYRAEVLRLRIQGKRGSEEEKEFLEKLKEVSGKNEKDLNSIGSQFVGLESESYYAESIAHSLKEGEHICMCYNFDAEAQIDFIKLKLSEDKRDIEKVVFIQIKSSDNKSEFEVKDVHENQLRSSYEDHLHTLQEYREEFSKFSDKLDESGAREFSEGWASDNISSEINGDGLYLLSRNIIEKNNIINAEKFYSQTVRVYRDEKDRPNKIEEVKEEEIFLSEKFQLMNIQKEIDKLEAQILKRPDSPANMFIKKKIESLKLKKEYIEEPAEI